MFNLGRMKYTANILPIVEELAVSKYPREGKCKKSCFKDGSHRVGIVPILSLLDGALAGDLANVICLECGQIFNQFEDRWFIPKDQPSEIKI